MERKEILRYAATSANLYNFTGDTDFSNHINVYKGAIANALQAHDAIHAFAVDNAEIIDPYEIADPSQGDLPLFISFHAGSFNLWHLFFLRRGYDVNVLSDTESVNNEDYQKITPAYRSRYEHNATLKMLNVEESGSIFSVIRELKANVPTVAFIDGNKGIGGQISESNVTENLLRVKFLDGYVWVRKGLAYISYLTKRPISVVLAHHEDGKDVIEFGKPIDFPDMSKEEYCKYALKEVFKRFEDYLEKYPEQWSNWLYVHNWTDKTHFKSQAGSANPYDSKKIYSVNHKRFAPLKFEGNNYLFDRITYSLITIEEGLSALFSTKTSSENRVKLINIIQKERPDLIAGFVERQIFI